MATEREGGREGVGERDRERQRQRERERDRERLIDSRTLLIPATF